MSYNLDQTIAGRMFHATTAYGGVAIPIYSTTTAHTFAFLNPSGSNRFMVPVKLSVGYGSATTPALSSLGLGVIANAGATYGTGMPVVTATAATVYNGRLGRTIGSSVTFYSAATTTAAATLEYELGLSQESATPGTGMVNLHHEFNDSIAIEPNTFITLVGAPLAVGQPLVCTLTYYEVDYKSI
jgi:hypothetical protein